MVKAMLHQRPLPSGPRGKQRSAGGISGEFLFLDKEGQMQLVSTSKFLLLLALKAETMAERQHSYREQGERSREYKEAGPYIVASLKQHQKSVSKN